MSATPSQEPLTPSEEILVADLADGRPPKRRHRLAGLLLICFVIGIVVGPMLGYWLPDEAAKWKIAAAEELWLDGDLQGAIESIDKAIDRFPENANLYLRRAQFHLENETYEQAIEDCDRVLELEPQSFLPYFYRSQAHQHLRRHEEAIDDCKKWLEQTDGAWAGTRVMALNALAYARAVGKMELEDGLKNVEEALRLRSDSPEMLDTRGYLHYLLGNLEAARADLDQAVAGIESRVTDVPGDHMIPDQRLFEISRREMEKSIAVIRYHRALVYDKLGEPEKASQDRQRVRELGFEPNDDLF